ncbi:UPF0182 family protein [Mycetocola saprophilus]|uniref:UPF0182 family membrane protein n=1 Tax=Mycetocola saprophilus TaxID=76636 RepID=UPI0004BFA58E
MTSASNTASTSAPRKKRSPLALTVIIVGVLVVAFFAFSGFYTDFLWYDQLGFTEVLATQWIGTSVMFLIGFIGMAVPVWLSIQLAYRLRPVYAKLSSQLDRYQELIEPLRRLATYGIPVVLGLFAGLSVAGRWKEVLLWFNSTPTGTTDPQFGLDASFYMFELPFFRGVVAFASAVILLSLILTAVVSYLYGSIHLSGRELRISKHARVQIAVLAGVYLLLQAVSIWLDQYATLTTVSSRFTGVNYADANATIPGKMILAGIAALVAILFFVTAFVGRWRLPVVGTALLLVSALVLGLAYPALVQRFQVQPNEKALETPYLQKNIDLTRAAYGLSDVQEIPYAATTDAEPGALRQDAETTANIRIIDPAVVTKSFQQLEQFKQYYSFPKVLDVDRYEIDGRSQDAVVAVRELNQAGLDANWVNSSLVYTHGYGLVAAYGNKRSSDGQPVFMQSGIPSTGELGNFEPRVYFGEQSPRYSIVGAPKGTDPIELDYPASREGDQQAYYTFTGDGGPKLDNIFKKLVYALKFQSEQIFLSSDVTNDSQILYDRDPAARVKKAAPYLDLDSDPYPSVVDGRIVWIVDGYTTSADFPYSKTVSLSNSIQDSEGGQSFALDDINYMRNSVKATVDAYDGSVKLYAWDTDDAILKTWQKIYPNTIRPISEMSGDLLSHVRYPSDMFKVQRKILGDYHVTNAGQFFSETDKWITPSDPQSKKDDPRLQPPYYLTMQMPGQDKPSFSLYSSFIPPGKGEDSRNVLTGYLAADANAGNEKGKKSADYGKLRLLTLTSGDAIPGPGQVQNTFNANQEVSKEINLLKQGQTEVINGNLLTVPVGGGLLYVQPVYVQSSGTTKFPLLQRVLVAFGDKIAFKSTLDEALDELFGGDSGASAGDGGIVPTEPGGTENPGTETPDPGTETPSTNAPVDPAKAEALRTALNDAAQAMKDKQKALESGDWAAYGTADKALSDAVDRANAALK